MEDSRQSTLQNQHMHVRHVGWMYVALVVIAFAAVIGTGFGVYYLQQGQVESLEKALSEKNEIKVASSKEITPAATTTAFNRTPLPYTFDYPSSWSLTADKLIDGEAKVGDYDSYLITLSAPGTVYDPSAYGAKVVKKGTVINIGASKSSYKAIAELRNTRGFQSMSKDAKDVTFGGVAGVQFIQAWEGPQTLNTSTVKDGWQYTISMDAEGGSQDEELTAPVFKDYEAIVKSFKFR